VLIYKYAHDFPSSIGHVHDAEFHEAFYRVVFPSFPPWWQKCSVDGPKPARKSYRRRRANPPPPDGSVRRSHKISSRA
jgi:hypothetical protein